MDEYTSLQNELDLYLNFFKRRSVSLSLYYYYYSLHSPFSIVRAELALDYGESLRKLAYKQQELDRRFDEEFVPFSAFVFP